MLANRAVDAKYCNTERPGEVTKDPINTENGQMILIYPHPDPNHYTMPTQHDEQTIGINYDDDGSMMLAATEEQPEQLPEAATSSAKK